MRPIKVFEIVGAPPTPKKARMIHQVQMSYSPRAPSLMGLTPHRHREIVLCDDLAASEGMMSLSNVAGLVSKMLEDAIDQGAFSVSTQSFPSKEKVKTTEDQIHDQCVPSE